MTVNSENTKTPETSQTSIDVEKQENGTETSPQNVAIENNNHFFEEKVKEKEFFVFDVVSLTGKSGINGSLVFLYAVFFSVFTIGWINLNRCPINRLIPIYLILAGFLGALAKFVSKFHNKYGFWAAVTLVIINLFWHIVGTYVVYTEYQPNYNPKEGLYCNRTTYLVAFWSLTIEYTLLVFFILLSCCYMLMRRDFRTESGTK